MALPGVSTVIRDKFQTLTRSNLPDTIRLAVIGRRNSEATPDPDAAADFTPVIVRTEQQVVDHFGEGSELHRGFLEAVSAGAPRVVLISWGDETDVNWAEDLGDGITRLDRAFEAAEAVQADIIVPWGRGGDVDEPDIGLYADDQGLLTEVANKCKEITDRSNPCFAVMGVSPAVGTDGLGSSDLTSHIDGLELDPRESIHPYVCVVVTELRPVGYLRALGFQQGDDEAPWANGAATYGGFLATLQPEVASTGKRLYNIRELRYAPTRVQQEEMVGLGLTPVKQNFSREAVVVDGLTYSPEGSDYARLSTLRIVFAAIELVRQTAENYVGYPATMHHRNAMDTAIGSQLRGLIVEGALIDADYNIAYAAAENTARIDLILTPAFEMRNIEVSISIRL